MMSENKSSSCLDPTIPFPPGAHPVCAARGIPPSPSVYWNHGVSGKMRFYLWAATSYGQNLDVKELRRQKADKRLLWLRDDMS
jgi:hypothetical protein